MDGKRVMGAGSVIVDVASNSAYALPKILVSEKIYRLAELDENTFVQRMLGRANLARGEYEKAGFALATLADERNGYLAGVDVLVDGGCTNGKRFRK